MKGFEKVEEQIKQEGLFVSIHRVFMCETEEEADILTQTLIDAARIDWANVPEHRRISIENGEYRGK